MVEEKDQMILEYIAYWEWCKRVIGIVGMALIVHLERIDEGSTIVGMAMVMNLAVFDCISCSE